MKWSNLLKNLCPNCGSDLADAQFNMFSKFFRCKCGFMIRESKFKKVITDMKTRELEKNYQKTLDNTE